MIESRAPVNSVTSQSLKMEQKKMRFDVQRRLAKRHQGSK